MPHTTFSTRYLVTAIALLMLAAFFLSLATYMVMPAVNIIFFSVLPPETKASNISASNVVLNLVIAVLSIIIGLIIDAAGLRLAFGGVILTMYTLGIVGCLVLLRTYRRDMSRRDSMVETRLVEVG